MPLQRLPIRLLQLFVGQEGELIISCVYTLNTASQAMSRALVTQLFVKLCSSRGLSARFGSVIKLIIHLPCSSLSEVRYCDKLPRMFTFSSSFSDMIVFGAKTIVDMLGVR